MAEPRTNVLPLRRSLAWQGRDPHRLPRRRPAEPGGVRAHRVHRNQLWVDPELELFVVLLTNRVHPVRTSDAILGLRRRFHNAAVTACLLAREAP